MNSKNIVFRVDANSSIGSGHFVRCSVLANELARLGHNIRLVTDCTDKFLLQKFRCLNEKNIFFSADSNQKIEDALGENFSVDVLIVDHYQIDAEWESRQRSICSNIMVIDDLADRKHDCDLLLDQNYYANSGSRYDGLVPDNCIRLTGPAYSLLRPEYYNLENLRKSQKENGRILVFLGSSDIASMSELVVEEILAQDSGNKVSLLIGTLNQKSAVLKKKFAGNVRVDILGYRESLCSLLCESSLGIFSCGSVMWEAFAACLPCAILTMTKEQIPLARQLDQDRYLRYLGHSSDSDSASFRSSLSEFLSDTNGNNLRSEAACSLVDGKGTLKVVAAFEKLVL